MGKVKELQIGSVVFNEMDKTKYVVLSIQQRITDEILLYMCKKSVLDDPRFILMYPYCLSTVKKFTSFTILEHMLFNLPYIKYTGEVLNFSNYFITVGNTKVVYDIGTEPFEGVNKNESSEYNKEWYY